MSHNEEDELPPTMNGGSDGSSADDDQDEEQFQQMRQQRNSRQQRSSAASSAVASFHQASVDNKQAMAQAKGMTVSPTGRIRSVRPVPAAPRTLQSSTVQSVTKSSSGRGLSPRQLHERKMALGDSSASQQSSQVSSGRGTDISSKTPSASAMESRRNSGPQLNMDDDEDSRAAAREPVLPGAVRVTHVPDGQALDSDDPVLEDDEVDNVQEKSTDKMWVKSPSKEMAPVADGVEQFVGVLAVDEEAAYRQQAEREAQEKLFGQVVEAEQVHFDDDEDHMAEKAGLPKNHWIVRYKWWLLLLLVAIIGIVVGVAVGVSLSKSNDNKEAPTPPPQVAVPPPPPTESPTVAPITPQEVRFSQDNCETAALLDTLPMSAQGTTMEADFDTNNVPQCDNLDFSNGKGVWFQVQGSGQVLGASLCDETNFDTQISIFESFNNDCGALTCLQANDQRTGCGNGDQSQVFWPTEEGKMYYIMVHGVRGATGRFQLSVAPWLDNDLAINPNSCTNPIELQSMTMSDAPQTIYSTLAGPQVQTPQFLSPSCSGVASLSSTGNGRGLFYSFSSPNFGFYQIEVSDVENYSIVVYEGGCTGLQCVTASTTGTVLFTVLANVVYTIHVHASLPSPSAAWDTFALTISPGGTLRPDPDQPENVRCESAQVLDIASADPVASTTAFGQPWLPNCARELFPGSGPGVSPASWFVLEGTGSIMIVSTCLTENFDTQISVYSGSCDGGLECVAYNDQVDDPLGCGEYTSSVSWHSGFREVYYVVVQGVAGRVGDFNLTAAQYNLPNTRPIAESCNASIELFLGNPYLGLIVTSSDSDVVSACDQQTQAAPAIWHKIKGTGKTMIASTCDPTLRGTEGAKLVLLTTQAESATCDSEPVCVPTLARWTCGELNGQERIVWDSVLGQEYYLVVHGKNGVRYTLTVDDDTADTRECAGAVDLSVNSNNNQVQGYTYAGQPSSADACDTMPGSNSRLVGIVGDPPGDVPGDFIPGILSFNDRGLGAWYRIGSDSFVTNSGFEQGEDSISLSLCSGATTFDAQITVFSIASGDPNACDNLQCIASNNGESCGPDSHVTWMPLAGEDYFLWIRGGSDGEFGSFLFAYGSENAFCETASAIPSLEDSSAVSVSGSLDLGVFPNNADGLSCPDNGAVIDAPGVWYTFAGDNRLIQASLCNASIPAQVFIFAGQGCDDLLCEPFSALSSTVMQTSSCESAATWFAISGTTYYIFVSGAPLSADISSTFELVLEEVNNESCDMALGIPRADQFVTSASVARTSVKVSDTDPCLQAESSFKPSWFAFQGTGAPIGLSACDKTLGPASSSTQVAVATGECDSLECASSLESSCETTIDSVYGRNYKVLVSANASETREFTLSLTSLNGECETAFGPLPRGSVIYGDTRHGGMDGISPPICEAATNYGPGLWYTYLGEGRPVTVYTCGDETEIDSQISVYESSGAGRCGSLSCVRGRDNNCGQQAWATFLAANDVMYYIYVSGQTVGRFVLYLE